MRIAVVAGFRPNPYGEAHYASVVFDAMAKQCQGDVQTLVLAHVDQAPAVEDVLPNLTVKRVTHPLHPIRRHLGFLILAREIIKFRPDVVHLQGTHTRLYGGLFGEPIGLLLLVLRLLRIPTFLTVHGIWMPEDIDALCERKSLGPILTRAFHWYYRIHLQWMVRLASYVNVLTAGDGRRILEKLARSYGLATSRLHPEAHPCLYAPVTRKEQEAAKASLALSGHRIILATGFVRPDKGYHLLLDCASELLDQFPDLFLVVAGHPRREIDTLYAETLEGKRSKLSTRDRIRLEFRFLSEEDLATYLDAADIVVLPYTLSFGPSGPMCQALGRGKAVVASALGHNLDFDGVCRLFRSGDSQELGEALKSLLRNEQEMETYKLKAENYAHRHSWDGLARQYASKYRSLMAAGMESACRS